MNLLRLMAAAIYYTLTRANGEHGRVKNDSLLCWLARRAGKRHFCPGGWPGRLRNMARGVIWQVQPVTIYSSSNFCRKCAGYLRRFWALRVTGPVNAFSNYVIPKQANFRPIEP